MQCVCNADCLKCIMCNKKYSKKNKKYQEKHFYLHLLMQSVNKMEHDM